MINTEIEKTAKRRGMAKSQVHPISDESLKNLEKYLEIATAPAEDTTDAREKSCKSIRNAMSFFIAAFSSKIAPYIINYDAKSWEMGDKKKKKSKAKLIVGKGGGGKGGGGKNNPHAGLQPPQRRGVQQGKSMKVKKGENKGITAFFLKTIFTFNIGGQKGEIVHLIASKGMPIGEMHIVECDGIGYSGEETGDPALLVFARTRTDLPPAFQEKVLWDQVVLPLVATLRKTRKPQASDKSVVFLDGGDDQLEPFKDPNFQAKLKQLNISAVNPAGGSTEITQACDQRVFRDMNNYSRGLNGKSARDVPGPNTFQFKSVAKAFAVHENHLRAKKWQSLPAAHKRQGIDAVVRATVCQQKAVNPIAVKGSFDDVGLSQTMTKREMFDVCMGNCTTRMTDAQEETCWSAVPELIKYWDAAGTVTEAQYDQHGIPSDEVEGGRKAKAKDQRVTCQQRAVLLTHPESQKRLAAEKATSVENKAKKDEAAAKKALAVADGTAADLKPYQPRVKKVVDMDGDGGAVVEGGGDAVAAVGKKRKRRAGAGAVVDAGGGASDAPAASVPDPGFCCCGCGEVVHTSSHHKCLSGRLVFMADCLVDAEHGDNENSNCEGWCRRCAVVGPLPPTIAAASGSHSKKNKKKKDVQ